MELKISDADIRKLLGAPSAQFPKYTSQLINLANQNAGGTRPRVVGQMSELVGRSGARSLDEWGDWYQQSHPDAIREATDRIVSMMENLKRALNSIDRQLIEKWVHDLVLVKTFIGLRFHEAILKKVAENSGASYRLASPEEESKGIDGYIGETPVSIKPRTYDTKRALPEQLPSTIIFYEKTRDGILVEFEPF